MPEDLPPRSGSVTRTGACGTGRGYGRCAMSVVPTGGAAADALVPYWLTGERRAQLTAAVQEALDGRPVHPVSAIHLQDVLTELHVAAARDAVWPTSSARVRLATGWGADVLPVRLSAAELAGVLALPTLPPDLRGLLGDGAGE